MFSASVFHFLYAVFRQLAKLPPLPQERTEAGWFVFKPTQLGDCMREQRETVIGED